jgi:hypothetical protein
VFGENTVSCESDDDAKVMEGWRHGEMTIKTSPSNGAQGRASTGHCWELADGDKGSDMMNEFWGEREQSHEDGGMWQGCSGLGKTLYAAADNPRARTGSRRESIAR